MTPTNLQRAACVEQAIIVYREHTGTNQEDVLADLLCDLMHWSDAKAENFGAALISARANYMRNFTDEISAD